MEIHQTFQVQKGLKTQNWRLCPLAWTNVLQIYFDFEDDMWYGWIGLE